MKKLENILVVLEPHSEEQPALTRAAYLAEAAGASLHLFMCAYDAAIGIASFLTGGQQESFVQTVVDGSGVMIDRLSQSYRDSGLAVTREVVWDRHPAEAILKACEAGNFDLVVKRARHHYRADAIFNHTDWNLMRYCPHPILLVRDGQWDEVGQVLAAVDAAPQSDKKSQLNRAVLEEASYLASTLAFELHLVSAYPAPPLYAPVSTAIQAQDNYRSKMSAMVTGHLTELAAEFDIGPHATHAVEGPVDWVISEVSQQLVAEFVVMGNSSREGLAGINIGSTAEATLDAINTNVLIVRETHAD